MNGSPALEGLPRPHTGLSNGLASTLPSPGQPQLISVLGESAAVIRSHYPNTEDELAPPGSTQQTRPATRTPGAVAHAVGHGSVSVHASSSMISVYTSDRSTSTAATELLAQFSCVPILPRDVACARLDGIGVVVAIAGACGVMTYAVEESTASDNRMTPEDNQAPRVLSGSYGYPCVAVAVSKHSFVAAATVDGRVAVWELLTVSDVSGIASGKASVFEPREDCPIHDRVTELVLSRAPAARSIRGVVDLLAVAWWSGRVDLYVSDDHWAYTASFISANEAGCEQAEEYCDSPGTYVAFNREASVLAVCTGQGRMSFLSTPDFVHLSSFPVISVARETIHVKGIAADSRGVVAWLRERSEFVFNAFPEQALVSHLVNQHAKEKASALYHDVSHGARMVYSDVLVQLTISSQMKCLQLRQSGSKKTTRVPFPCNASNVIVDSRLDPSDIQGVPFCDTWLYSSHLTASPSAVVLLVNFLIFVYGVESRDWAVIISHAHTRLVLCSIAKFGEDAILLCAAADGRAWRWRLKHLDRMDLVEAPLVLPDRAQSMIGCFNGTGSFAVISLAGASTQREETDCHVTLTLIDATEHRETRVRTTVLPIATSGGARNLDELQSVLIGGLWCTKSLAVLLLSLEPKRNIALSVSIWGPNLRVSEVRILSDKVMKNLSFGQVARSEHLPDSLLDVRNSNVITDLDRVLLPTSNL
jgi:hypothetical protein